MNNPVAIPLSKRNTTTSKTAIAVSACGAQPAWRTPSGRILAQPRVSQVGARTGCQSQQPHQRLLEEWKREELRRTPFALLDDPPEELRPKKGRKVIGGRG